MFYDSLKILHIISATLVLTSIIYSYSIWRSSNNMALIAKQTWLIIIPFAIIQLLTGFMMISLKQYDVSQLWITGSVIGFVIMICSWLGFICGYAQSVMLSICGLSLLSMIFFMANKI